MCGICGYTGDLLSFGYSHESVIKSMGDTINHRGPDGDGFFHDDYIHLCHKRLSIIDIDGGAQPMFNEDKTKVLIFNGEIYNYKDLREKLILAGHIFTSNTDSEVLLHGFEEYGFDLVNHLRGMFAFCIYDTVEKSLFLARDMFGIKPLYYRHTDNHFSFASEIKALLAHVDCKKSFNQKALDMYLSFQYCPQPYTFFNDIFALLPGHYMTVDKNNKISITRYFEPTFNIDKDLSIQDAVKNIEQVFEDSVNAHKIADVPVACFLSSGVDSSYVSTFFADQECFTVGFDFGQKYNETTFAKELADEIGVNHHSKLISSDEFWGAINHVQYHMDLPLADPSCIALYFVANIASKNVKVVLSGEGADELFGGYQVYTDPATFKTYRKLPQSLRTAMRKIVQKSKKSFRGQSYITRGELNVYDSYIGNANMFSKDEKLEILKDTSIVTDPTSFTKPIFDKVKDYDDETKMQYLDMNTWLIGDILLKADRMSMANSLELRVPFLDKKVFKVSSSLPTPFRVNKFATKYALRKAAIKHMPEKSANREKLGFPVPTRVWLKDDKYYNIVKEAFLSKTAQKFFNTDKILRYLDEHKQGLRDHSRKVWTIFIFLCWYNIYFIDKPHDFGKLPEIE